MNSRRRTFEIIFVIFLAIAGLAGLIAGNLRFARQNPGGNDFLVHWVGTRALLTEGISPYSDEVALRIQTLAYGRPALSGEHQLRVAYPLYSSLIFAPFAIISDYNLARAMWMTLLEVSLLLTTVLLIRLTRWQPGILITFMVLIFTSLWYHGVRPIINGNVIILITLFITSALLAIRSGLNKQAGIFLALSTIKPQVVVLVVILVVLWAVSQRKWRLILWTFGSMIVFTLLGMFFIPDWLIQNLQEVIIYPGYNPPGTPTAAFLEWWPGFGRQLGWGFSFVLAAILLAEWRAVWGKDFRWFLWSVCLTLVVSQWIGIQTDPGNYIILILPLILVMTEMENHEGRRAWIKSTFLMLSLLIGQWLLFFATVEYRDQPQQHSIMLFPLPLILMIGIYWVRRWVIRLSPELFSDPKAF